MEESTDIRHALNICQSFDIGKMFVIFLLREFGKGINIIPNSLKKLKGIGGLQEEQWIAIF